MDLHAENGRLIVKSAHSYSTKLSMDFDQVSPFNISSIFLDAAKVTYSGRPLIIVPNSVGKIIMRKAEFTVNFAGEKYKAEVMRYQREHDIKSEFSFRIKDTTVNRDVLALAQQLTLQFSQIPTVASLTSTCARK